MYATVFKRKKERELIGNSDEKMKRQGFKILCLNINPWIKTFFPIRDEFWCSSKMHELENKCEVEEMKATKTKEGEGESVQLEVVSNNDKPFLRIVWFNVKLIFL